MLPLAIIRAFLSDDIATPPTHGRVRTKGSCPGAIFPFVMPRKWNGRQRITLFSPFSSPPRAELDRSISFRPPEKPRHHAHNLQPYFRPPGADPTDPSRLARIVARQSPKGARDRPEASFSTAPSRRCCRAPWPNTARAVSERARAGTRLARLLLRNPTDAERALWTRLPAHRRFACFAFKRQVPPERPAYQRISLPLRCVSSATWCRIR